MKKPEWKIDSYGTKKWYLNSVLHCEDGPAVECANGAEEWYLNSKFHREDGPAIEWAGGAKDWYLNGELYCSSWWLPFEFAKGFVRWIEAVKKLQDKK